MIKYFDNKQKTNSNEYDIAVVCHDVTALDLSNPKVLVKALNIANLRPTRQRLTLAKLLYGPQHQHITAEKLHKLTIKNKLKISLATVYNTLNQFCKAGLLRVVNIDGQQSYFDTNLSHHHHFYNTTTREVSDIKNTAVLLKNIPTLPEGTCLEDINITVHVKQSNNASSNLEKLY